METKKDKICTLHQLLDYDACRFISAEAALRSQLPGWIGQAGSLKLKMILQKYLDFLPTHIEKLTSFFEEEKMDSMQTENKVMKAFITETNEKLLSCADEEVKDACLLACIQAINHFKISTYGTAAAFAKTLGMQKHAEVFHDAEVNEKKIDDRLTQLAEYEVNNRAKAPIVLTT